MNIRLMDDEQGKLNSLKSFTCCGLTKAVCQDCGKTFCVSLLADRDPSVPVSFDNTTYVSKHYKIGVSKGISDVAEHLDWLTASRVEHVLLIDEGASVYGYVCVRQQK